MLDKFLFGNKHIPEMYFGNIPVAQIYFGNTLIWEKENYVPYDSNCVATVTLSQDKMSWIATITKNGEDVTTSLKEMVTWIYNGKGTRVEPYNAYSNIIDLSQFPRGDYRLDLSRITSKAGGYFPGSGALSFPDHIYIGNLVAGDQLVAIEYTPTVDTTINSIEIYTTSNQGDNNNVRVKILHESGLYIGAFDSDNGPDAAEIYHLSGYKRYVNNKNVLLKAGLKYYIVYQHDDANPGENTFWPAYFQNENGNYKVYSNNRDTVTVTDISSFGDYIGDTSNLDDVFDLSENDFFYWDGNTSIMDNAIFVRSNKGNGTNYRGILGNDSTYTEITKNDIITWLGYSVNDSYRWSIGGYQNLTWKDYYYKNTSSTGMTQTDLVTGLSTDAEKIATLLMAVKTSGSKTIGVDGPAYWFSISVIGRIFSLKSGFTVQINNLTPVSPSSITPQEGDIYYLAGEVPVYNAGVYLYTNNDWKYISDLTTILNVEYLDTYMTNIGSVADLTKTKISGEGNVSNTLRTTALSTNRKYYLKINGYEV